MAKGRKMTSSLSELFGRYGHGIAADNNLNSGYGSPELDEDDVWSIIEGAAHEEDERRRVRAFYGGEWVSRAAVETGAREERHVAGGLSLAFDCHQFHREEAPRGGEENARSAPVKVPVWSEIYRVDSVELWSESDGESEVVPPHVYLARGRRTGGTSVFEGVGRTLKGRDLRRVRDAVWSQTGFDG